MSLLRVENLRKRYKSRTVVQDVSLDVASGEVVGLLGPNGAGKTTCFYMIVGLVAADAGAIHLDGRELTHDPVHRRARLGIPICRRKTRYSASSRSRRTCRRSSSCRGSSRRKSSRASSSC
jgi:ABC-type lipopolysaccharide export system ATPase subunit